MINIGGDPNDASYRYQMPRLITKTEGRGNGIKTLIVNMVDVAKALQISPAYTTKYFGFELGAQSKFEKKTERAVVNGAHQATDLAPILDKFIASYILCPRCGLPEVTMQVDVGREKITGDCASCGYSGALGEGHRLNAFIVKHPPAGATGTGGKKGKKGAESKQDRKARKAAERKIVQKASATSDTPSSSSSRKTEEEEVEWHTDTSKEASLRRKEEEMKSMTMGRTLAEDSEKPKKPKRGNKSSPPDILREMLADEKVTVSDLVAEVKRLELARGFDKQKRLKIIFEAVFDPMDPKQVKDSMAKHAKFLAKYTADEPQALRFIGCLEEMIGVTNPKLIKRSAILFQQLYESDILDEEQILKWAHSSPESSWAVDTLTAEEIRTAAKPFIDWLETADADDSDEEEDEEE